MILGRQPQVKGHAKGAVNPLLFQADISFDSLPQQGFIEIPLAAHVGAEINILGYLRVFEG